MFLSVMISWMSSPLLFSEGGFSSMKATVLFTDADAGDVEEAAPFTQAKGLR